MACANEIGTAQPSRWEGAVGLVANWAPSYDGAAASRLSLVPAGFVRYGRLTVAGAGGFTTRRSDDVERGVAASLIERGPVRVSLALRFDHGRDEDDSTRLAGMGDIDGTLRGQLTLRWRPWRHGSLTTALSADLLGKGQGWWWQAGVHHRIPLGPDAAWSVGASLRWAGAQYAQRWFGVTPRQSARTGYDAYAPGAGLVNLQVTARLHKELGPNWSSFVGGALTRELDVSRASPLNQRAIGWSVGGGLVWRF